MIKRLDVILVEKAMVKSRAKAKELILKDQVKVNGSVISKPSALVDESSQITVSLDQNQYVGRGALKLKKAFEKFALNVEGKCCADIGASTGGFTQILLENGAKKVYAVDVGHGQLAQELVSDIRVVNCEGVNVRNITPGFFSEHIEFMCGDLSFISLRLVIPPLIACLENNGDMVMLIKPQFEAGKTALNKKGIVKDKKDHFRVLKELIEFFVSCGLSVEALEVSPITGGDGNIEYITHLKKSDSAKVNLNNLNIKELVNSAFSELSK